MKRHLVLIAAAASLLAGAVVAFAQTALPPPALIGDSRVNNAYVQETLNVTGASTMTGNVTMGGTLAVTGVISSAAVANYGVDAGSTDTYVAALTPAITTCVTGRLYVLKAATANTGAASVDLGCGAKTIVKAVSTTLANNDILAAMICLLVYDGTNMVLLNPRAL